MYKEKYVDLTTSTTTETAVNADDVKKSILADIKANGL
jgi:hypothetical protein